MSGELLVIAQIKIVIAQIKIVRGFNEEKNS
jgi:hypothetical protein